MALAGFADAVAGTPFADWAAGSAWAYPLANVVHVLGLVLLLGSIGILDLRILGLFRRLSLDALGDALTPLAVSGLVLMIASGSILFAADAAALPLSNTFRWKLGLIAVAVLNALAFRWRFGRSVAAPSLGVRAMALLSLLAWTGVAILGRWIAYS